MAATNRMKKPRVLLFDIGGVCVVSPMQAILDYEKAHKIPLGWVNHSIAASNPNGAWQMVERGEAKLDAAWYAHFKADLTNEERWKKYHARLASKSQDQKSGNDAVVPPVPDIDAEWLFWEMMRVARQPDPYMYPALKRLRQYADQHKGELILAAMSNTSIFPEGHPFNDTEGKGSGSGHADVKRQFDVFVSSAHVGMRKPAEDIYYYTIGRVSEFMVQKGYGDGVRASDFVFLDDIGGNLRTAKKIGMGTIKVGLGKTRDAVVELEQITALNLLSEAQSKL